VEEVSIVQYWQLSDPWPWGGGNEDHDFIQCDAVYVRKNVLRNFSDPVSKCTSSFSRRQTFQL